MMSAIYIPNFQQPSRFNSHLNLTHHFSIPLLACTTNIVSTATTQHPDMSDTTPRHQTCRHPVDPEDPRRGVARPICLGCFRAILTQAVISVERRFFLLVCQSDFDTSQRYYEALELAFAVGRYHELEYALWRMACQCVFDHPKLFVSADVGDLVVTTMQLFLSESNFEYTNQDARIFVEERMLVLGMQSASLNASRRPSNASDSGSIQLHTSEGTMNDISDNEILATEFSTMSID